MIDEKTRPSLTKEILLSTREIIARRAYLIFLRFATDYMLRNMAGQLRGLADYGDRI